TKTPALAAVSAVACNLILSLILMGPLGHGGLALATALAAMVNISILVAVLNTRLGGVDWGSVGRSALRVGVAAVPVVLACVWVEGLAVWGRADEWIAKAVMLTVGIGLSVTGYVGIHALLRSEELEVLWGMLKEKLGRGARGHGRPVNGQ
ncbi:MAG: lipid II flippase MurJ, partial [Acidimicrobiia bacterium]